jgi:serine protease Do
VALTKYHVGGKRIVTVPAPSWRGMRVDYLSAATDAHRRGTGGGAAFDDGVIVTEVEEETPAWQAGLRPGMLISHVNRKRIRNPRQFRQAVSGRAGSVQLQMADRNGQNPSRATVRGS